LIQLAQDTVNELGISAEIVKVYDINEIMKYDVMKFKSPVVLVNDVIKSIGRYPDKEEVRKWKELETMELTSSEADT